MKISTLTPLLAAMMIGACGGDSADTPDASSMPAMSADEQAIAEVAEYWVTHYNMGHPGMVASVYADESWFLAANGRLSEGPAGHEEALGENADASPQIAITPGDEMIFGDVAIGWGTYEMSLSPEGADPISYGGTYMNRLQKIDGDWKIVGALANLTDDPFEGFEFTSPEGEPGPDDETMLDLQSAFETHFNLGHPSMVADFYTEDAMSSFTRGGPTHGRAAISDRLTELMEENPSNIEIHGLGTDEVGDGWAISGGWFAQSPKDGGDPVAMGGFMNLLQQQDDGSWQIHWAVSNGWPADGM